MKNSIVFLLIGISCLFSYSQTKDVVHLSFNLKNEEESCSVQKIVEKKGVIRFHIDNEHFEWGSKMSFDEISESELRNINILNISSFIELAGDKRKELIREGEKTGVIHVLTNDKVFNKIYLYEKSKWGVIKRYEVTWIDSIID
ncbi:hypothetical protein [Sinomicrobium soli]|uniref:hypothetical protein n=1 Tax=Sinomicrobium sp. N-1-3-6 TaxID=2219864 RepID=UPI000DCD3393|nr:hypothetical protein [Sinomicrobium sp. N-1-3-6]RAV27411.1 hypothetical protein DN748_18780 [Sinomicrobium sp. N-1-3-6]